MQRLANPGLGRVLSRFYIDDRSLVSSDPDVLRDHVDLWLAWSNSVLKMSIRWLCWVALVNSWFGLMRCSLGSCPLWPPSSVLALGLELAKSRLSRPLGSIRPFGLIGCLLVFACLLSGSCLRCACLLLVASLLAGFLNRSICRTPRRCGLLSPVLLAACAWPPLGSVVSFGGGICILIAFLDIFGVRLVGLLGRFCIFKVRCGGRRRMVIPWLVFTLGCLIVVGPCCVLLFGSARPPMIFWIYMILLGMFACFSMRLVRVGVLGACASMRWPNGMTRIVLTWSLLPPSVRLMLIRSGPGLFRALRPGLSRLVLLSVLSCCRAGREFLAVACGGVGTGGPGIIVLGPAVTARELNCCRLGLRINLLRGMVGR